MRQTALVLKRGVIVIKFGMNLLLWTDSFTLEKDKALMDRVMDMGFDGLEIPVMAGMTVEEAKKMGAYLTERNIPSSALAAFFPDAANPVSPDKALRESAVEVFKLYVDCAKALGSDILVGPFPQGLGYFSGARPTKQEWDWSIDIMKRCSEYAGNQGISVAIEPLNRFEQYILNTVADGVRYVQEIGMEHVGLLIDTMHMNIEELDIGKAFTYALPYTNHIHISENNRGIPGTGHACGKEVFDAIKASDYSGWVTIEAFNEGAPSLQGPLHLWRAFAPSDDALAEQGLAHMKRMMA